jgi:hypothetical protein
VILALLLALSDSTRSGSTVTIEAMIPKGETAAPFAHEAHLDFTVTVPMDIDVRIADTSGDIVVDDVGGDFTVKFKKGSGAIRHKNAAHPYRRDAAMPAAGDGGATVKSSPPR